MYMDVRGSMESQQMFDSHGVVVSVVAMMM
jgi:hypothetical protein